MVTHLQTYLFMKDRVIPMCVQPNVHLHVCCTTVSYIVTNVIKLCVSVSLGLPVHCVYDIRLPHPRQALLHPGPHER